MEKYFMLVGNGDGSGYGGGSGYGTVSRKK